MLYSKWKHGDVKTNAKKNREWREISATVSVVGVAQRSDGECRKKASNLQSLVKTKAANIRSESSKTGGGPPPKPLSNQEETITLATLPLESVYGIDGGMDTSESQETITEEVCPEINEDEAVEEVTEEAAVTPVPHSNRFPPPVFNAFVSSDEASESEREEFMECQYKETDTKYEDSSSQTKLAYHQFNQSQLNDLVRDLHLSKQAAELLASRFNEKHLLDSSAKVSFFRKRDQHFLSLYSENKQLVYCNDIPGLLGQ